MRQKRILLALVEAMDFIDKQNSAAPGITVLAGAFNGFTDLFYARSHGGNAFDVSIGIAGNHFGQRGFARTGRPPQNHRVQVPGLNCTRQRLTRSQQMLLTNILR